MKLTKEQANQILYDDIYSEDGEELLYKKVKEKIISFDREKSSIQKEITIKDVKTNKKYKAILGESPWHEQDKYNAKEEWIEIK